LIRHLRGLASEEDVDGAGHRGDPVRRAGTESGGGEDAGQASNHVQLVRSTRQQWLLGQRYRDPDGQPRPGRGRGQRGERTGKQGETSIEYSTHGRLAKDGGIDAKLPGLGRIAVSFEQTKVHRVKFVNPACGNPVTRLRKGVFTGTIAFHGEGGFTKVHRRSAQGQIRETFRHVCDEGEAVEPTGPIGTPNSQSLFVAGEGGGGTISFSAAGPPPLDPSLPPSGLATVLFWARYLGELRGMQVSAYVAATSGSNRFSVTTTAGAPTDAMVKPPAPFAGEAVFHLESPTTASWAGDLRVELPGVGAVALAGPGTWAALCEGIPCTETLPPGVR